MEKMGTRRVCLDTSVLIHYLKGRQPANMAVKHAIINWTCCVTAMSVYELLFGMARARSSVGEESLLGMLTVLPFDLATARRAANLHDELLRRGVDIGVKDVVIAASCLENAIPLLTTNVRHFARVPTLQVLTAEEFLALTS